MNNFIALLRDRELVATDLSLLQKVKNVFVLYFLCLLCAMGSAVILYFLDKHVIQTYYDFSIFQEIRNANKEIDKKLGGMAFFGLFLIAPIFEELIFRLPLKPGRFLLAIPVFLLIYKIGKGWGFDYTQVTDYVRTIGAITAFLVIIKFVSDEHLKRLYRNYFPYIFFFSAVAFALVHLTNIQSFHREALFYYPVFMLPQFVMGLFFGYARVKYGLLASIALHAMMNLPAALFALNP